MGDSENADVIVEYTVSEQSDGRPQTNLSSTAMEEIGAEPGDKIQVRADGDELRISIKDRDPIAYLDTRNGNVPIYDYDQLMLAKEVDE